MKWAEQVYGRLKWKDLVDKAKTIRAVALQKKKKKTMDWNGLDWNESTGSRYTQVPTCCKYSIKLSGSIKGQKFVG